MNNMNSKIKIILIFYILSIKIPYAVCQSDIKFAMTSQHECGSFYEGIATICDNDFKYKFINRNGKIIGEAPGMLLYADKDNRIYRNYYKNNGAILTDQNNKILKKGYNDISYLYHGLFKAEKGEYPNIEYHILDKTGKGLYITNERPYAFFDKDSPYYIISNIKDRYLVFYKDQELSDFSVIDTRTLSPDFSIIQGFVKDKKTQKNTKRKTIIKETNTILYPDGNIIFMSGIDFFIIDGNRDSLAYYNVKGEIINNNLLATSSSGVKIQKRTWNSYHLVDTSNNPINDLEFEKIDPFLWQSDLLAVKKGDKWGYVSSNGSMRSDFEYDIAGPCIIGVSVVSSNDKTYLIDFERNNFVLIDNTALQDAHSFSVEIIDGQKIIRWENNNSEYGFYNLNKGKGIYGLREPPVFRDGRAITYYYDKNLQKYSLIVSLEGTKIANGKTPHSFFTDIGEGIYHITEEIDGEYVTFLYNKDGKELFNSKDSKVSIQSTDKFYNGVIPVSIEGGINNKPKYMLSDGYGYIYNVYTSTLEDIVLNYGEMGQNTDVANDFIQERVNYLDYYQILGNKAIRDGKYDLAITYFDKALSLNSICKEALYGKGISQMQLKDYSNALHSLSIVEKIPGTNYAKAVCYYNLSSLGKARFYCDKVNSDDPCYNEAKQLRDIIIQDQEEQKRTKFERTIAILNTISNSLNLVSQSMLSIQNIRNNNVTQPSQSFQTNFHNLQTGKQKTCSSCHGTGLNSAKERAAFYSYNEETYSNSPCEICGSRDSHYHKPCLVCQGRGYTR